MRRGTRALEPGRYASQEMGVHILRIVILLGVLSFSLQALATTWSEATVDDPIDPKFKCDVHEPNSYGSYNYNWPEKYDQVFWPLTDESGIWFCTETGFTAFIGDFKDISAEERQKIAVYLKDNYKHSGGIEEKLRILDGIYALRATDVEFKNKLLRVLARWYQNIGQIQKANEFRIKAFDEIKVYLNENISEARRLEYLYLAANYSMLFGEPEASMKYIESLHAATAGLKDKELEEFSKYLSDLAKETPKILPGGKIDPVSESDA